MIVPHTDTGRWAENAQALRELSLRNSAKWPRNFGIRGAREVLDFTIECVLGLQ
jgi:hypothetical protein